jgi:hypothetical protein
MANTDHMHLLSHFFLELNSFLSSSVTPRLQKHFNPQLTSLELTRYTPLRALPMESMRGNPHNYPRDEAGLPLLPTEHSLPPTQETF